MSNFILNLSGPQWRRNEGQSVTNYKGQAFLENDPVTPSQLAEHISQATSNSSVQLLLQRLNGFYAWVSQDETSLRACVDHARSWPLFYGQKNGLFYLSDNAEWIRAQVGDKTMDPLAREEFLLAGFVTGRDTLYPNVKQIQAGEYLEAQASNGQIQLKTSRYYRFWHTEPGVCDKTELLEQLQDATISAMRRLIQKAAGRRIVIPLSGGYDSRLVATMLKKLGYDNVLCFTYGVSGNKEAEYSRKIAKALGFDWAFVEYSTDLWREAWRTLEAEIYRENAANHTSLPHVQDWLAVKTLVERKKITSDDLIVPGHTGDFVAGGHIPRFVFARELHTEEQLLRALVKDHLSNIPKQEIYFLGEDRLYKRLKCRIASKFDNTAAGVANLYEMWDWQERQAKYIINSVRVYDQFELDWWLPLWDLEFVKFWEAVPLSFRDQRWLCKQWITEQYTAQVGEHDETSRLKNASDHSFLLGLMKIIAKKMPQVIFEKIKIARDQRKTRGHFLAVKGLVPEKDLDGFMSKQYNIIGIYSELYLTGKW